jgi:hypothetical protein
MKGLRLKIMITKRLNFNDIRNDNYIKFYKFLFDEHFKPMSNDSKILYCLIRDRLSLSVNSVQNGKLYWIDKTTGEIFIHFTVGDIQGLMNCSNKTAIKLKKELIKYRLIEEMKTGFNKPNRIYVLDVDYTTSIENTRTCKNYTSISVKSTLMEVNNLHSTKTNINKTEISKTDNNNKDRQMSTKEEIITNDKVKSIANKEIAEIKSDIERVVNGTINIKSLKKVLNESDIKIDDIKYYLDNWNKFKYKSKDNPIGFFLDCVKNKVPVPKREQGFNKPDQSYNFDQREYDDTDFEGFDNGKYNS